MDKPKEAIRMYSEAGRSLPLPLATAHGRAAGGKAGAGAGAGVLRAAGGRYNHAVRLARAHGLDKEILSLALQVPPRPSAPAWRAPLSVRGVRG